LVAALLLCGAGDRFLSPVTAGLLARRQAAFQAALSAEPESSHAARAGQKPAAANQRPIAPLSGCRNVPF